MRNFLLLILFTIVGAPLFAFATINITSNPSDAKIYIGGQLRGTGFASFNIEQAGKIQVKVEREGYVTFIQYYSYHNFAKFSYNATTATYKRGQNNFTISLIKDENYVNPSDVSVSNDSINSFYICYVNPKFNRQDAWKKVNDIVSDYFDDFDTSKNQEDLIKTNWETQIVGEKKIRTRFIIKLDNENPLSYKFKLQSEYSDNKNAYEYDNENFKVWDRILKKYNTILSKINSDLTHYQ